MTVLKKWECLGNYKGEGKPQCKLTKIKNQAKEKCPWLKKKKLKQINRNGGTQFAIENN